MKKVCVLFLAAVMVLSLPPLVLHTLAGPQLTTILSRDANNVGIQSPTQLAFQDATGTPIVSPALAVTTTPKAFIVPANAVTFIFSGTTALRYGDNSTLDGSGASKGYKKGSLSTDQRVPCSGVTTVWISAEAGTSDVDFCFEVVK